MSLITHRSSTFVIVPHLHYSNFEGNMAYSKRKETHSTRIFQDIFKVYILTVFIFKLNTMIALCYFIRTQDPEKYLNLHSFFSSLWSLEHHFAVPIKSDIDLFFNLSHTILYWSILFSVFFSICDKNNTNN